MRARALAACAVALLAAGCGRPRTDAAATANAKTATAPASGDAVVELDLSHGVPESGATTFFGTSLHRSHADLVRAIESLEDAKTTKGFFVRLGGARVSLASATEVGELLAAARKAGKPVVCHADELGTGALLLAAKGCDRVWMSPAGGLETVGIAAELVYAHSLLTKLHVDVDFLQVGKYKGAEEPFTRDGPSPEARASLEGALRGVRAAWIAGIEEGRGKPGLGELAEDGPYSPEEAKAKGFVDEVGYADDALEDAKKRAAATRVSVRFGGAGATPPVSRGIVEVARALAGASHDGEPHVALVRATGGITMGGGGGDFPFGGAGGITERGLGKVIDDLEGDASTKAVVVRIDSPGGSALASDLLWKRLMKLRKGKPLVFSVGGMAASGGYYLSCTGTKIVAEPTSIVGSIGVVGGKLSFGRALDEIGVHAETIAASPDPAKAARASYMSPFASWDDATRGRVLASMTSVYDLFLTRVAEGRGIPKEKVAVSAEGQVFGGVEAKERGLVDELGGLERSLALAKELAKLPADAPVDLVGDGGGLDELLGLGGDEARAPRVAEAAKLDVGDALVAAAAAIAPELADFMTSAAPLAHGERTLAALPFALLVR